MIAIEGQCKGKSTKTLGSRTEIGIAVVFVVKALNNNELLSRFGAGMGVGLAIIRTRPVEWNQSEGDQEGRRE
jgi:hypothetical protein